MIRQGESEALAISVIIPSLNEADEISRTLDALNAGINEFEEVIVVDGGSTDATLRVSRSYPCRVVESGRCGRAYQMNLGAQQASGDILFFLHADTSVPYDASRAILSALRDKGTCAGGFSKVFDHDHPLLRGGPRKCRWRHRLLRTISGDQGFFIRRETFQRVGGYPEVNVMEEFALCKRIRGMGRLVLLPHTVTTSARRFVEHGVLRCYARMGLTTILYYLGLSPRLLERVYFST